MYLLTLALFVALGALLVAAIAIVLHGTGQARSRRASRAPYEWDRMEIVRGIVRDMGMVRVRADERARRAHERVLALEAHRTVMEQLRAIRTGDRGNDEAI